MIKLFEKYKKRTEEREAIVKLLKKLRVDLYKKNEKIKKIDPNISKKIETAMKDLDRREGWSLVLDKQLNNHSKSNEKVTELKKV